MLSWQPARNGKNSHNDLQDRSLPALCHDHGIIFMELSQLSVLYYASCSLPIAWKGPQAAKSRAEMRPYPSEEARAEARALARLAL